MRVLLLLTACSCSALQTLSLQALTPAVQQAIAQRATLQTLHDAASGAALWRQCFLEGRVPDETLDDVSWPDEPTRAACLVAFDPVARVVGRHPRLADLALLALIDAATSSDEEDLEPLAPTVAAVSAIEAVYGDAAGLVIDALLNDEVAAWMGTAASADSRGRFERRAGSFATLEALAKKLRDITELVPLLESLGRRATAEDGKPRVGATRRPARAGSLGACDADAVSARDGYDGVKLGRDVASLAAHDRLLLVDEDAQLLFRAKYASRTLVEAAPAGLDDTARSVFAKRRAILPRGRRGPLVVCVDTSYSMAGGREAVAKAVALAVCRVAAAQKRSGLVLAFGAADELAEVACPGVGATAADVDRLLDFLERGFGGGTDVVGPLRRAVAAIERGEGDSELADADILLVTDGELLDPPADAKTLDALDRLRSSRGLRVHGLLVGRSRLDYVGPERRTDGSERFDDPAADAFRNAAPGSPLDVLCDNISTFLAAHDDLTLLREASAAPVPAPARGGPLYAARGRAPPTGRRGGPLYATADDDDAAPAYPVAPEALARAAAALERGLVERAAEARLVLLGAATREHVLLVGPPGVGKSLLCRRLGALFSDESYFEVALTRFTTPDDVFGPLSLKALREDESRRAAEGFAGGAEVVFLDEIFRARALLPALLQLLNERTWPDGSRNRPAALVSAVAATNALRDADDDDDDALFDRFLFRRAVAPVSDAGALDLLLTTDDDDAHEDIALLAPLAGPDALRGARAALPRRRAAVLASARAWLRDERGEYVSDRRLRRCSEAIRAAALACGRAEVGPVDLLLAADALWQWPESRAPLVDWLIDAGVPDDASTMRLLLDALRGRDGHSEADAEAIVAAAAAARKELAADAAATAESECVFLAPTALAAAKQRFKALYAARLSALDGVLESATAVRDAIRAGAPLPAAEDAPAVAVERGGDWDDDDDDDEADGGKKRKKKGKKKKR